MLGMTRAGAVAAGAIVVVFLTVAVIVADLPNSTPVTLGIRLGALWGTLAMAIAALMSPFLAEIRRVFGAPFLRVHHVFAAFGLAAITLHPVLVAVRSSSLVVFLPVTSPARRVRRERRADRAAAHLRRRGRCPDQERGSPNGDTSTS